MSCELKGLKSKREKTVIIAYLVSVWLYSLKELEP